jgi:hypothetical protein
MNEMVGLSKRNGNILLLALSTLLGNTTHSGVQRTNMLADFYF